MPNQVIVELSAKDAEMVAAWQRRRKTSRLWKEKLKSTKEHSKGWTSEMKEGFEGVGDGIVKAVIGFEAMKKVGEGLVEVYRENVNQLHEIVAAQRESREELTHMLAKSGKLKQAPEIERGLAQIDGAFREEKQATYKAVSEAAPELNTKKQVELVKEIAPLAGILGRGGSGGGRHYRRNAVEGRAQQEHGGAR